MASHTSSTPKRLQLRADRIPAQLAALEAIISEEGREAAVLAGRPAMHAWYALARAIGWSQPKLAICMIGSAHAEEGLPATTSSDGAVFRYMRVRERSRELSDARERRAVYAEAHRLTRDLPERLVYGHEQRRRRRTRKEP